MNFKVWNGEDLQGDWEFSIKIDGVRCHKTRDNKFFSRGEKELYNIPQGVDFEVAEIFCGSWEKTIENVRTFTSAKIVKPEEVFPLHPSLDLRLLIGTIFNPRKEEIEQIFNEYYEAGNEGLVLRQGDKYFKVKKEDTYDVKVLDIYEGKGRLKGKLGGFITEKGRVGSGLCDKDRKAFFCQESIGTTIEVKCMALTRTGKFRHPRFVRMRYDK